MNYEQELVLKIGQLAQTGVGGVLALLLMFVALVALGVLAFKKAGTKALVSSFAILALVGTGFFASAPTSNAATLGNSNQSVLLELDRNSEATFDTTVNVGNDNLNGYSLYARTQGIDLSKVSLQINGVTLSEESQEIHKTSVANADANYAAQIKAVSSENAYLVTGKIVYTVVENTPDMSQYYTQSVNWHACYLGDEFDRAVVDFDNAPEPYYENYDCATIEAPVNWYDQNSPKISLALARYNSHNQAGKLGSIVFNPGGPGIPGIEGLIGGANGQHFSEGRNSRITSTVSLSDYDIVSFDPRGVGRSTQLDCSDGFIPDAPMDVPTIVNACFADTSVPELPYYMDTVTQAHDLDLVRAAVGDEKLNYTGFSWGTILGAAYTGIFPDKVGKMYLDGIIPFENGISIVSYDTGYARIHELSRVIDEVLNQCVNDPVFIPLCPITGPDAATPASRRLWLNELFKRSIVYQNSIGPVDPLMTTEHLFFMFYDSFNDSEMDEIIALLEYDDQLLPTDTTDWDTFSLDISPSSLQVTPMSGPANTDLGFSRAFTSCEDARMTSDQDQLLTDHLGVVFSDIPALKSSMLTTSYQFSAYCALIPEKATPNPNYGNLSLPTILLSRSTWDYNTPPELSDRVVAQFPSTVMITYDGAGHCAYSYSQGVMEAANTFFNTGVLPPNGAHYPRAAHTAPTPLALSFAAFAESVHAPATDDTDDTDVIAE